MTKTKSQPTPQGILKTNFISKYLREKLGSKFKYSSKSQSFTCPKCMSEPSSAMFIQGTVKVYCHNPECKFSGSIIDVVRLLEPSLSDNSDELIAKYLSDSYEIILNKLDAQFYFKAYEKFGFDMVVITANDKKPFNPDGNWQNEVHKNIDEWIKWHKTGFNIGVKTGKCSNITVIDFDDENIVPDIFKKFTTAVQKSNKGFHYVFQYDPELPNYNMRFNKTPEHKIPVEILNDGRQFVVAPSRINGIERTWNFRDYEFEIPKMSDAIKNWVLERIKDKAPLPPQQHEIDRKIKEDIKNEVPVNLSENINLAEEGSRNSTLLRVAGVFRKKMNLEQTAYGIRYLNKNFLKNPLPEREIYAMLGSLDKYIHVEEKDLAMKIYDYLRFAQEATSQDIVIALEENKIDIDKAIAYLIKERFIARRGRTFHLLKKMQWRDDDYDACSGEVPFKVPYFDDICVANWGDMFILGGLPGTGKTTISMNILKRLVDQGVKPYYVCLETGSRFTKTATALGIRPSDYYRVVETDPTRILIEPNSVTILDWLLIKDKEKTDTVMQHFTEQLVQTNSFLIVLMQLKKNPEGEWFAPNMVDQFPAFAARYLYEKNEEGEVNRAFGHWKVDKIREARKEIKGEVKIPCKYIWNDKTVKRLDELNDGEIQSEAVDIVEI